MKQKGFLHIGIVIAIVVVMIGGATAIVLSRSDDVDEAGQATQEIIQSNNESSESTETSEQTEPENQASSENESTQNTANETSQNEETVYLEIQEWGIKIPLQDSQYGARYEYYPEEDLIQIHEDNFICGQKLAVMTRYAGGAPDQANYTSPVRTDIIVGGDHYKVGSARYCGNLEVDTEAMTEAELADFSKKSGSWRDSLLKSLAI